METTSVAGILPANSAPCRARGRPGSHASEAHIRQALRPDSDGRRARESGARRGTCEHLGARAGRRGTSVREHGVELVGAPRREWRTGSAGAPMQEQRITARTGAPARARVVRTAPHRVSWRSGAEDCLVEGAQAQSAMGPQPRTAGNAWVRSSPAAPFGFQGARPKNKNISNIRPLGVFPRAC